MNTKSNIWRLITAPVFKIIGLIETWRHKMNLAESFKQVVIVGDGRDALRLYENGRSVRVPAELMSGSKTERLIYKHAPIHWEETDTILTSDEKQRVLQKICEYLDKNGVKWQFSEAAATNWK